MRKQIVKDIIHAYNGDNKVNDHMKAIATNYIARQPLEVRIKMLKYVDDIFKRRSGIRFIENFSLMVDECEADGTIEYDNELHAQMGE